MNRTAWYIREEEECYTARIRKDTHCLLVPASAPHQGPKELKLPLEHGSQGPLCNVASLELALVFPHPSLCMQLTFMYLGCH